MRLLNLAINIGNISKILSGVFQNFMIVPLTISGIHKIMEVVMKEP